MSKKVKISMTISIALIIFIIAFSIQNKGVILHNPTKDKTSTITNEIQAYGTDYVYVENMPSTAEPIVLVEGVNGIDYTYDGLNYTHISDMSNQVVQVGTGDAGNFTGKLTGYGPDCPGCSSVGNVSCITREGKNHSLISDGIYYNDITYGEIRILAADNSKFPCGTVIKIENGVLDSFYGIVLDTGSSMRHAWSNGNVWIDLAFPSQKEALTGGATSSNTKFNVQRWGW